MSSVSLMDVVRPYFFVGMDLGPGLHEVLEFLHVDSHEIAWDDDGVVITGETRVGSTNPSSSLFSPFVGGHQPDSDQPRPARTWHGVSIGFRLSAARRPPLRSCRPRCRPTSTPSSTHSARRASLTRRTLKPPAHYCSNSTPMRCCTSSVATSRWLPGTSSAELIDWWSFCSATRI